MHSTGKLGTKRRTGSRGIGNDCLGVFKLVLSCETVVNAKVF